MEHLYFYEDEVFRLNKKGNLELGMVLRNAEHVSSDEEDDEYYGSVKNGYIKVAWHPSGVEQVLHEKKVGLADRSLMPGDVVRRLIKGKDTQRGYCRNINVKSDLQVLGSNQIILNVNSKELPPVEDFLPGIVVGLNWWVGTVKSVSRHLHLSTRDGSRCVISDTEGELLEDLEERRSDSEFPHRSDYHPGQVLVCGQQDLLSVQWITPPKDLKPKPTHNKLVKFMVQEIVTQSVHVHWQCLVGPDKHQKPPPNVVEGDDLKTLRALNIFESCTLQIGDRSFYNFKESDTVLTKEAWRYRQEWALFSRKSHWRRKDVSVAEKQKRTSDGGLEEERMPDIDVDRKSSGGLSEGWETDEGDTVSVSSGCSSNSSVGNPQKKKKTTGLMTKMLKMKKLRRTRRRPPNLTLKPNSRYVVETVMTYSNADVVWQDGTVETGISSTDLYPIHHLDDQEFFPGDFVVENKDSGCIRLYGVVQSVDHVGRLAKVTWFHTYTPQQETEPKKLETVEVSVYDLKDHPDFQYRPGTVALRIANSSENSLADVGQVLDNYPEGRVHMWWVDGSTSMCWPQDLFKVADYDSDDGELWDDNGSEGSWETESEEEELEENNMKALLTTHIEKARVSMSKLEDLFTHNPSLQNIAVMHKLLEVYRDCRYLDKLMGTAFFDEAHFQGLLERVREKNKSSLADQRLALRICRDTCKKEVPESPNSKAQFLEHLKCCIVTVNGAKNDDTYTNRDEIINLPHLHEIHMKLTDMVASCDELNVEKPADDQSNEAASVFLSDKISELFVEAGQANKVKEPVSVSPELASDKSPCLSDRSPNGACHEGDKSPNSAMSGIMQSSSQDDSGVFEHSVVSSTTDNCYCITTETNAEPRKGTYVFGAMGSRVSYGGAEKRAPRLSISRPPALSVSADHEANPCARLCSLIKKQLCLACIEVSKKLNDTPSVQENASEEEKPAEDASSGKSSEVAGAAVDVIEPLARVEGEGFEMAAAAPATHKFRLSLPANPDKVYMKTVARELMLLKNALPPGIWVMGYEDRMDLYTIMIRGPEKTPYEDGLFLFDAQLPRDYPRAPPIFHYHSYCGDRLNPNLYEDGKVCVSLLGTWKGRGTEIWTHKSTLLQVIVSIQGLILVKEPYYNEAGYEKQKGSQQGHENSRMYNEMAILKLVQAMTKLSQFPHTEFHRQIKQHFAQNASRLTSRIEKWLDISEKYNEDVAAAGGAQGQETDAQSRNELWQSSDINMASAADQPDFPLLPASRGFCITMRKTLDGFRSATAS